MGGIGESPTGTTRVIPLAPRQRNAHTLPLLTEQGKLNANV
jgi:hypothetical protein